MRTCGLASCIILSMIQLIHSREYAHPSPTDMPYSQRDILNKKQSMKSYIKALKSFKLARPDLFSNETDSLGHLLVEDERIRIPPSAHGLGEVTKMYLDQNKLNRYIRILDMELARTPATIELDASKIIDYVKLLNTMNKHEGGKSADLVSRSRIKLMKGGITDNIMYDEKGHQQEADFYDVDYQDDNLDTESVEKKNYKSIHPSADKNIIFFDSPISDIKHEASFNEDLGFKKVNSDLDFRKLGGDVAVNQNSEIDNYDLESDSGDLAFDSNIQQANNENLNIPTNKLSEEEPDYEAEPSDEEFMDNIQIQIQPSIAPEFSGFASAKGIESDPQERVGDKELHNKIGPEGNSEKPLLDDWSFENEKTKEQSLFDSPFDAPVPINHVNSKEFGGNDEKRAKIKEKRGVELLGPKLEQQIRYENTKRMESNNATPVKGPVKDMENLGSILNKLQDKLYNMEKPVNKLNQLTDTSDVSNLSNSNLNHQFLQNMYNNMDLRKAIDIKTAAFFRNFSIDNLSSTDSPINSFSISNGPPDHMIFPLKPEDEIIDVPKMKYFEQCFDGENNNFHFSHGMPTKPPNMFSNFYISRLKKFQKYDDDSGTLNFLKQPRLPLFGTKENEISKILNVNLDHLHVDREALFKIIGKALRIDDDNAQKFAPPKWLEHKYEELLHASHRGQNFNDYDYIVKSMHNLNENQLLNIRDRKESNIQRNNTNL